MFPDPVIFSHFILRLALVGASEYVPSSWNGQPRYLAVPQGPDAVYAYTINFEGTDHQFSMVEALSFTANGMSASEVVVTYVGGETESLTEEVTMNVLVFRLKKTMEI